MSRAELNARNLRHILESLTTYLHTGGPLSIATLHGEALHENDIVFRVEDWDAFVGVLEPMGWQPTALGAVAPSQPEPSEGRRAAD